jgi:hypothetical protein
MVDVAPYNDFPFSCQPDCSVYERNCGHKEGLNFALIDFFIEFKTLQGDDPFLHQSGPNDFQTVEWNPLMSTTTSARAVAGQITSYTAMLLSTQYRTHTFSVLVVGDYARLIRWDRASAVIIEPIYYNKDPSLFDFLLRYDHANTAMHGHDTTVGLPTADEERNARTLDDLVDAKSLLLISIQHPSSLQSSHYIISSPHAQPAIPKGRWT